MDVVEEDHTGIGSLELTQNRLAKELYSCFKRSGYEVTHAPAPSSAKWPENLPPPPAQSTSGSLEYFPMPARLREQRTWMARIIGNTDPELALAFLSATLPYVQSGLPTTIQRTTLS